MSRSWSARGCRASTTLRAVPPFAKSARPVLFIGGKGRSGSTLMSRMLSGHPGVVSVGELRFVAVRGWQRNELCSCSLPFRECPFWREIGRAVAGRRPGDWYDEFAVLASRVARMRHAPKVLLAACGRGRPTGDRAAYVAMLGELVDAIGAVSGAKVILDSSKDPIHGLHLTMADTVSIYPVHLVRDCRGVAFSLQRRRIRPEVSGGEELMPRADPRRTAIDWDLRNLLTHVVGRSAGRYRRILYEEMVSDPQGACGQLLDWAGLDPAETAESTASEHEVSGNPMRFDPTLAIKPDLEWVRSMDSSSYLVSTALGTPLLSYYGYPLSRSAVAAKLDA